MNTKAFWHQAGKRFMVLLTALALVGGAAFPVVFCARTVRAVSGTAYTVSVSSGYLALRTAKAYDSRNEIGELYSGDTVYLQDGSDSTYWYVYSPKLGKYGYVNRNYLIGGGSSGGSTSGTTYTVSVSSGYLALRTAMAYDSRNEIGQLYSGDTVTVQDFSDATYWYVYSPKLGKYGYVNRNYLIGGGSSGGSSVSGTPCTVSVSSGYLALRTAMAYDSSNEIGALYSGETVYVQQYTSSNYWYVYSPKLGKYGYVNCNYLIGGGSSGNTISGTPYTVSVASGYLALRTAMAYDSSNEIGSLYSGDTVYVQQYSSSNYWYVYSPKLGKYGYVNCSYLIGGGSSGSSSSGTVSGTSYTVNVASGYLALRTAMAYDSSNEIGRLYSGETVYVQQYSSSDYWYVYSPKLGKYGYVNANYLY